MSEASGQISWQTVGSKSRRRRTPLFQRSTWRWCRCRCHRDWKRDTRSVVKEGVRVGGVPHVEALKMGSVEGQLALHRARVRSLHMPCSRKNCRKLIWIAENAVLLLKVKLLSPFFGAMTEILDLLREFTCGKPTTTYGTSKRLLHYNPKGNRYEEQHVLTGAIMIYCITFCYSWWQMFVFFCSQMLNIILNRFVCMPVLN